MPESEENYNASSSFDSSSELSANSNLQGSNMSDISTDTITSKYTDGNTEFESDTSDNSQDSDSLQYENETLNNFKVKVEVEDEDLFDSQYSHEISNKITSALTEMYNDSQFQTLVDQPTVHVSTSIDPAHPFCFRVRAEFSDHSPVSAFAFFSNVSSRSEWDSMCQSIEVLKTFDELTCIYHLKLKKKWPATARDSLMFSAFRKLNDEKFISVAWSIEDENLCPQDPFFIRMQTRISANLFEPKPKGKGFILTQLIDGDPKGNIPSYLVKSVSAKAFPSTISSINSSIFSNENFYKDLIKKIKTKTPTPAPAPTNRQSNESTNDLDKELKEILERLKLIDHKLSSKTKSAQNNNYISSNNLDHFLKWTPLLVSTCNLVLLINLNYFNLRKK